MSFLSDIFLGGASKKAAKAQVKGAQMGVDELHRQFDLNRADLAPWREAGSSAINAGAAMLKPGYDYTASPGYQYRLGEGNRAIEGSAASKGMLMSGGTLKDIDRFSQGLAAQDFGDQFNRQMAIAGGGQQAATSGAQLGQQTASGIADLYTQQGNARASGYIGQANAIGQTIGQVAQLAMMASDRRLKTNIVRLGEWDDRGDGLGEYEWNWKADPDGPKVRGVIADEVKELRPSAYAPNFRGDGFDGVNYAMLETA
jgi:hypothetical protein